MTSGFDVRLANTLALKQHNGLKYTDDKTDARHLAHLLRLGVFPQAYIYPFETRSVRDLLRRWLPLVRQACDAASELAESDRSAYRKTPE